MSTRRRNWGFQKVVAKLLRCVYGTRDAGMLWEDTYADFLQTGFTRGVGSPCCFFHSQRDISVVVHGDDFTALGLGEDLDWYESQLKSAFEIKVRGRMSEEDGDDREMRILNRIVRLTDQGLRYEADPRHAEMIIKSLGLESGTSVSTPGIKEADPDIQALKDDDQRINTLAMNAVLGDKKRRPPVTFVMKPEVYEVTPYAEIYGTHPKLIVATRHGWFRRVQAGADPYTGRNPERMNRRKSQAKSEIDFEQVTSVRESAIIASMTWSKMQHEVVLANSMLYASKTPPSHNKWQKKRLGAKKVKRMEKLSSEGHELNPEDATLFRAVSARANYLAQDRPDISYAAKELCRDFSQPTRDSYCRLKRLGRYLLGQPRLVYVYDWQPLPTSIDVFVDTDFAGCRATRRSTSGGCAMMGQHCVRHWSSTQSTIALSSGEAELGGLAKGAAHAIGLKNICVDLGWELEPCLHSDATAAIGIARRRGVGKIRHLDTADLWIQEKIREKALRLEKVLGLDNPGDAFTKYVERALVVKHMTRINLYPEDGRAATAPKVTTQ